MILRNYTEHWVGMCQCWLEAVKVEELMCALYYKSRLTARVAHCNWFWICKSILNILFFNSIASLIHRKRFYPFFFFFHRSLVTRKIIPVSNLSWATADLQNRGYLTSDNLHATYFVLFRNFTSQLLVLCSVRLSHFSYLNICMTRFVVFKFSVSHNMPIDSP